MITNVVCSLLNKKNDYDKKLFKEDLGVITDVALNKEKVII